MRLKITFAVSLFSISIFSVGQSAEKYAIVECEPIKLYNEETKLIFTTLTMEQVSIPRGKYFSFDLIEEFETIGRALNESIPDGISNWFVVKPLKAVEVSKKDKTTTYFLSLEVKGKRLRGNQNYNVDYGFQGGVFGPVSKTTSYTQCSVTVGKETSLPIPGGNGGR